MFKILNCYILGGFQKNEFWGMKIFVDIFWWSPLIELFWGPFLCFRVFFKGVC